MAVGGLDWLYGLAQFGIKFGLENIRAVVAELGHPERHFKSVHVAGTNGKGSVTALVDAALRASGHRTGRYTSPHLLDLRERFVVDGTPVSEHDLLTTLDAVREAVARLQARGALEVHPTFFEITTAVAFELFRRHDVAVAVCEVGLGGRLDATNVLSPVTCAITSIAFDHEQYLGHSLRDIALEKAGIVKPGVPVVVGPLAAEADTAIAGVARERHAPLVRAMHGVELGAVHSDADGHQHFTLQTPAHDYGTVRLALAGAHQVLNAVVAVRLLEEAGSQGIPVAAHAVADALASVRWPGRLEHLTLANGADALLDAAHNAAGAEALARYLATIGPKRPLVFSAMRDKDALSMLRFLVPHVSRVVVTRASNPRADAPQVLAELVRAVSPAVQVDVVEAPADAVAQASAEGTPIVVAGSIFLLADVMREARRS